MILKDIGKARLLSQQIANTTFKSAKELVGFMGAMQAQDLAMAKWAIGVRLPGSTEKMIEAALDKGEIIRTHLLRPTWHLVSADDVHWLLDLTAPRIKASMRSRHKELELTEAVLKKSNNILEKALTGNKHLTREELTKLFEKAKIPTDNNRLSHIMFSAELDGLVCSGAAKGAKQTYALLEERVHRKRTLKKDEALAKLVKRYFSSHGPATLQDFTWWSGLSLTDARNALEMVRSGFISETINSETYWFSGEFAKYKSNNGSAHLLPAFDEFIISYRDRTAVLPSEQHKRTISDNGIFRPVIVVNGQVAGIWKRTIKKDKVIIETAFFQAPSKDTSRSIEKASAAFGDFLARKVELIHNPEP